MFSKSAAFYDAMYAFKDYAAEAEEFIRVVEARKPEAKSLLDVACGTGLHLSHLQKRFDVEGLDLDPGLLAVARERLPGTRFHEGDMRTFDLGRQFDVIACLFSSIGYALDLDGLDRTVACFAKHLPPGGVLVVDPWIEPDRFTDGHLGALFVDQPELKVARMHVSEKRDRISAMRFEYLVGTPSGIERLTEDHLLGLFTREEQHAALDRHGFASEYIAGPMDRGRFVGVKR